MKSRRERKREKEREEKMDSARASKLLITQQQNADFKLVQGNKNKDLQKAPPTEWTSILSILQLSAQHVVQRRLESDGSVWKTSCTGGGSCK